MNKFVLVAPLLFLLCFSCQTTDSADKKEKKVVEETPANGMIKNADIIRNPVSANKPLDTINVAKMVFKENKYDFGKVYEGDKVQHKFTFTNTGKVPLIISDARSTCGCTVPKWPKEAILPGKEGEINVVFNTKGKKNQQQKPVTISANTYPEKTVVYIKGFVIPVEDPT